jgi:hypothetical protein
MKSSSRENSKQWFTQHPLISTVLWYLGADQELIENGHPSLSRTDSHERGSLRWKDDHGGSIAEYMYTQEKKKEKIPTSHDKDEFPSQSSSETQDNSTSDMSDTLSTTTYDSSVRLQREARENMLDMDSESPNWGWYVAITPPQPEMFTK